MQKIWTLSAKSHGSGALVYAWTANGNYVASCGSNKFVFITDRHGENIDDIQLPGEVRAMEWDKDGEKLAIIFAGSGTLKLWDINTKRVTDVDTSMKDLTFIAWSLVGPQLAVGTQKGNLLIFNKQTQKKIPIIGKHTKKIVSGAWSKDNVLALGAEDKQLTLSKDNGDNITNTMLKAIPFDIKFGKMKKNRNDGASTMVTVSLNCGKKTIFLFNPGDPMKPLELKFHDDYKNIVAYKWFGDGYMCIGFAGGQFAVVSTHMDEIGNEVFSDRIFRRCFNDIAVSMELGKVAVAGDDKVVVYDINGWKVSGTIELVEETMLLDRLTWTDDGQILSLSTKSGHLLNYLTQLPVLGAAHNSYLAYLTSLLEVSIVDTNRPSNIVRVALHSEPSFVALGPNHLACGMNNRAWFYQFSKKDSPLVMEKEYLGTVQAMCLNSNYAAMMSGGRAQLHRIVIEKDDRDMKLFPERDDADISCIALTNDFFVYGTSKGNIQFFYLSEWKTIVDFRHTKGGIKKIYVNNSGTRVVFVDSNMDAWLYNPVNDFVLQIEGFPRSCTNVLWELNPADAGVFAAVDDELVYTFVHTHATVFGPTVEKAGQTQRPDRHTPLMLIDGRISSLTPSGAPGSCLLETHTHMKVTPTMEPAQCRTGFKQNLAVNRLESAWRLALAVNDMPMWVQLGRRALEHMDVEMAVRVYRQMGDAGMVMALDSLLRVEDRFLLGGHICTLFGEYGQAQDLFLQSTKPLEALVMRRDLLHWEQALQLSKTLAPEEQPFISREYGQQLEFKGEYQQALERFDQGLRLFESNAAAQKHPKAEEHKAKCTAGIARNTIRLGDLTRGVQMAAKSGDKQLCRDCAAILEGMTQFSDAALLYNKGGNYEKAAAIYIQTKQFSQAEPLMKHITAPHLHLTYAKAMEAAGKHKEAEVAYETAQDFVSVIRLNLDHLNNVDKAFRIVREMKSGEGARMIAAFCIKIGDFRSAIEFHLMSNAREEAFQIAHDHKEMAAYTELLGENGTADDYTNIALYYEQTRDFRLAGHFYVKAKTYHRALKFFLQAGEEALDEAIDLVGLANSDVLTHQLIDYLSGEIDNVPKDPKYIYRVYVALGNIPQMAAVAIKIAEQEQEDGKYKQAHDVLYDAARQLERRNIKLPSNELMRNLCILHSYILVKSLVKMNDHLGGARMLIRVANNISRFPSHIVQILTTTVIECHRSGLKRSSFEWASMLMRAEYRDQVHASYRKKIEQIVRRPDKSELDEEVTPCPVCDTELPVSVLDCTSCRNTLPFCIASGCHMTLDQWSQCPHCKFPAQYDKFCPLLDSEHKCPMCSKPLEKDAIVRASDPSVVLKAWLSGEIAAE